MTNKVQTTLWFVFLLLSWAFPQEGEALTQQSQSARLNFLLYSYEKNESAESSQLLPIYNYARSAERQREEFSFWPFLSAFVTNKNTAPTVFPNSSLYEWYSLPLLTLGNSQISPEADTYNSVMVSFMLMTYIQESEIKGYYSGNSWYSLPVMSSYSSEIYLVNNKHLYNTHWGTPLFYFRDTRMVEKSELYTAYEWSFEPASLILGDRGFEILYHGRWGRDMSIRLFTWEGFSLFEFSTTYAEYPGAEFDEVQSVNLQNVKTADLLVEQLITPTPNTPRNRFGIFSPFFQVESDAEGLFTMQILPFFIYRENYNSSRYHFPLLGFGFGEGDAYFVWEPKLFPLIYQDEFYGTTDILWPIFRYRKNPRQPSQKSLLIRFLLQYETDQIAGQESLRFSLVERLLFSYIDEPGSKSFEILPSGLLMGYYDNSQFYQWRVLGFGYMETASQNYLQLLFFKIPID